MQVLDQQVAAPLAIAKQVLHLGQRRRIDLPSFRRRRPAPPPGARMNRRSCAVWERISFLECPSPAMREREGPAPQAWEGDHSDSTGGPSTLRMLSSLSM